MTERGYGPKDAASMVLIAMLAAVLALTAPRVLPFMHAAENWTADVRTTAFSAPRPQSEDIVLVTVTEDTLATLAYRAPLDRGFLARLLARLDGVGPRAVVLDILFDQPTEPAKDDALRLVFENMRTPLVVATARQADGLTPAQDAYLHGYTQGLNRGLPNFVKDSADGVVRWIFPGRMTDGGLVPGLAGGTLKALGVPAPEHSQRLHYRQTPDAETPPFRAYPAHVANVLPADWFKDRIVLIGADLPLNDRHRTPQTAVLGGADQPGVLIHAHALAHLLDGTAITEPSLAVHVAIVTILAALGMVLAVVDWGLLVKGALTASAALTYGAVTAWLWRDALTLLPVVSPVLGFGLSLGGGIAYFGRRDRELKKFIRKAFAHYLSPQLVERLIKDPSRLTVGGERRELTYIFTDIAGFTTLTEQSNPTDLVPMLNTYIDAMCQIAMEHGATLDKVIGDATVSFFNAPLDQDDHPARAVACALAMDAFARDFARRYAEHGMAVGKTRIGVHTGSATIGNFGGDAFFDYTAFGDMVNTAARLESVNKHLGTNICVSGATARRCPDVAFRPVGRLVLKGKSEGIEVFEPLDHARAASDEVELYGEAYRALVAEDPSAADLFARVLDRDADDPLARMHLARLKNGEKGDIIVMKEK